MDNFNDVAHAINKNSENIHESKINTTVITQSKTDGVRNEIWMKMRNTEYGIKGWKACAVETVGAGLMLAGIFFIALHGKEAANSVKTFVSNTISQ